MIKRLLLVVGLFALIYALLYFVAFSSRGQQVAAGFLKESSRVMFHTFFKKAYYDPQIQVENGRVAFAVGFLSNAELERLKQEAAQQGKRTLDISVKEYKFYIDLFYIPLLFLITLILVTTLPWKKKLLALLWGILLFVIFYLFRIWLFSAYHLSTQSDGIFELSAGTERFIERILPMLELSFSFFVAMLIWLLLAFRNSNWREVLWKGSER